MPGGCAASCRPSSSSVLVALATAGVAAAGNGGFAPVTPRLAERRAHHGTRTTSILGFTAVDLRPRRVAARHLHREVPKPRPGARGRGRAGARPHAARADLDGVPGRDPRRHRQRFVFWELPSIDRAPAAATNPIHITVEGHQYYWQFDYPEPRPLDRDAACPGGAVVDLRVVSPDVIHSWWIPALGGKIQAIPGQPNHTWFQATKAGPTRASARSSAASTTPRCSRAVQAELGRSPTSTYITKTAAATLGAQEWSGVCATCHGNLGQGGYGPAISQQPAPHPAAALAGIFATASNASERGDAAGRRHVDERSRSAPLSRT